MGAQKRPNTPTGSPLRKFVIGFDYNLTFFHLKQGLLDASRDLLNYVHLPAPGLLKKEGEPARFKAIILH